MIKRHYLRTSTFLDDFGKIRVFISVCIYVRLRKKYEPIPVALCFFSTSNITVFKTVATNTCWCNLFLFHAFSRLDKPADSKLIISHIVFFLKPIFSIFY